MVSLLTDISSESVSAILPLYLTAVVGLSTGRLRLHRRPLPGRQRPGPDSGGWSADRTNQPKWVAFAGYGLSMVARFFLLFATGLDRDRGRHLRRPDRQGHPHRSARRDDLGRDRPRAPRPRLRRAPHPGHRRRRDRPTLAFVVLWAIPDGYGTVMVISLALRGPGRRAPRAGGPGAGRPAPGPPCAGSAATPGRRFRWRDVATPQLTTAAGRGRRPRAAHRRRRLHLPGAARLRRLRDALVPAALRRHQHRLPGPRHPARPARRPGRPCRGSWSSATSPSRAPTSAPRRRSSARPRRCSRLAMLGTFYAATDGVLAAVASRLVPDHVRASGIASAQTVVAVARMGSAAGFGGLWFAVGPRVAMIGVAVAVVVVVPLALTAVAPARARGGGGVMRHARARSRLRTVAVLVVGGTARLHVRPAARSPRRHVRRRPPSTAVAVDGHARRTTSSPSGTPAWTRSTAWWPSSRSPTRRSPCVHRRRLRPGLRHRRRARPASRTERGVVTTYEPDASSTARGQTESGPVPCRAARAAPASLRTARWCRRPRS